MVGDNSYSVQFKVDIPLETGTHNYAGHKITDIKIAPADTQVTSDDQNGLAQAYGAISNISLAVLRGKVNPARYDAENGLDIYGYNHAIDVSAIKHIVKNHSDSKKEELRG